MVLIILFAVIFIVSCADQQIDPLIHKHDITDQVHDDMDLYHDLPTQHSDMSREMSPNTNKDLSVDQTFTVAIVSDLNGAYGSTQYGVDVHGAINWLIKDVQPDLVLSTGDMVAGQKQGIDHQAMWRAFHLAVTTPLKNAGIPFAPTPGNHDASGYSAFEHERNIYTQQWHHHKPAVQYVEQTYYPLYYAFRMGPALFISLDDTLVGKLGGPQMTWLDDVLKANSDLPLKFVYGHIPLWAVSQGREDEILADEAFEQLLKKHQVTAFISGHHHAYYPGKRDTLRLINLSCLGAGPRKLIGTSQRSERGVVVLRYNKDGVQTMEAHTGKMYQDTIAREDLPEHITHLLQTIVRDDL